MKTIKKIGLTTEPLEDLIEKGHSLDFRLNEPEWKDLRVGAQIEFIEDPSEERSVFCEITGLIYYKTFKEMISDLKGGILPKDYGEHLLKNLFQWWTKEEEEQYGVLGIRVEVNDIKHNTISETQKIRNIVSGNLSSYNRVIDQSNESTIVYKKDEWTVKDIIGHIATWNNEAIQSINAGVSGSSYETDFVDGDKFNYENVVRLRAKNINQIIELWISTHKGFLEALNKLEKENPIIIYPWGDKGDALHLIEHMMEHEEGHFKDIMSKFSSERTNK